ncbi:hypothetical protein BRADI_1g42785v3 [Brachypodium distachyon]|uniref:Uncharacterized protein n=1 Tax=Brachypodium distachyon TaxID=15368 RepID=A0A2K2DNZ9_BRADI|nr:hypothetical protein BRADI_1g42785v3 [Brachypodium distachyon]
MPEEVIARSQLELVLVPHLLNCSQGCSCTSNAATVRPTVLAPRANNCFVNSGCFFDSEKETSAAQR